MMRPQFNQGLCSRGARKQTPIIGEGDVVHTNPYASLEPVDTCLLRYKLNIGRIGCASREPDRFGPIG